MMKDDGLSLASTEPQIIILSIKKAAFFVLIQDHKGLGLLNRKRSDDTARTLNTWRRPHQRDCCKSD